jgi:uncharacterized protein involved in exopolysaccharide biosynthesis
MTDSNSFLPILFQYRWKIIILTLLAGAIAAGLCFLVTKEYAATATLLPANSKLMDKHRLTDNNIQELYSNYGNSDDADHIHAIMQSSQVLLTTIDSLSLSNHYHLNVKKDSRNKTLKKLSKQMEIESTEFGEIKLMVWDKDSTFARAISNSIIYNTQNIGKQQVIDYYKQSQQKLQEVLLQKTIQLNALDKALEDERLDLKNEINTLKSSISSYKLAIINTPPVAFVVEQPSVSPFAERPNPIMIVIASMIAATFCSIFWVILFGKLNVKSTHVN